MTDRSLCAGPNVHLGSFLFYFFLSNPLNLYLFFSTLFVTTNENSDERMRFKWTFGPLHWQVYFYIFILSF
jgi:hypothetical protein